MTSLRCGGHVPSILFFTAMIFVTVGTDMPFDRLIAAVDDWAGETGRTDLFAQIGIGGRPPRFIGFSEMLPPPEFAARMSEASTVIAHAGMGTILTALRVQKPILVMPRRASLGEQRNEHQLATAHHLRRMGAIEVAMDATELREHLDAIDALRCRNRIGPHASDSLLKVLSAFIRGTPATGPRTQRAAPSDAEPASAFLSAAPTTLTHPNRRFPRRHRR